jgi:hypothetical protein
VIARRAFDLAARVLFIALHVLTAMGTGKFEISHSNLSQRAAATDSFRPATPGFLTEINQ